MTHDAVSTRELISSPLRTPSATEFKYLDDMESLSLPPPSIILCNHPQRYSLLDPMSNIPCSSSPPPPSPKEFKVPIPGQQHILNINDTPRYIYQKSFVKCADENNDKYKLIWEMPMYIIPHNDPLYEEILQIVNLIEIDVFSKDNDVDDYSMSYYKYNLPSVSVDTIGYRCREYRKYKQQLKSQKQTQSNSDAQSEIETTTDDSRTSEKIASPSLSMFPITPPRRVRKQIITKSNISNNMSSPNTHTQTHYNHIVSEPIMYECKPHNQYTNTSPQPSNASMPLEHKPRRFETYYEHVKSTKNPSESYLRLYSAFIDRFTQMFYPTSSSIAFNQLLTDWKSFIVSNPDSFNDIYNDINYASLSIREMNRIYLY